MPHGDRKKQRLAQKEARRRPPVPAKGRCCLCKQVDPKHWSCAASPTGGHIILEDSS